MLSRLEYPKANLPSLVIESISHMAWSVVGICVVFDKLLIKFGYCMWCMAMGLGNLVTWCVRQWCKLRCNLLLCCFNKFCCSPIHKTCKPRKKWNLLHVEDNVTWPMESVGIGNGPP